MVVEWAQENIHIKKLVISIAYNLIDTLIKYHLSYL